MADYTPERGELPAGIDLAHGIIRSTFMDRTINAGTAIARRLAPHGGEINAYDNELLLPASAPDLLRKLHVLVELYESQLIPGQVDLIGITTLRFEHALPCHRQWEMARGWAHHSLTARSLAVELIHHVPGLAGRRHKPHIHALWPVRQLNGSTFGAFIDLAKPGARAILAAEWAAWLAAHG